LPRATWAHEASLIFVSLALSQTPAYMIGDYRHRASVASLWCACFVPNFASTSGRMDRNNL